MHNESRAERPREVHVDGFAQAESYQGGVTPENYAAGGAKTYLACPIRIDADTASQALVLARQTALELSHEVDRIKEASWVTDSKEAAYALLSNAVTSLQMLSSAQRLQLLMAFPSLDELRDLLGVQFADAANPPEGVTALSLDEMEAVRKAVRYAQREGIASETPEHGPWTSIALDAAAVKLGCALG